MNLLEVVRQVRRHLEESGRVSYRMLRRQFDLEDDALEELIDELVDVQRIAVREKNALAWSAGPGSAPAPATPERDPRDYTPKHLADRILQSKSALEGERKQVTVLFADVKGSMDLAEQVDPEKWHGILNRFFEILADGVHRFEGTVNQYTGDGIMALFGAPIAHEDHAQRACYAALHLRDALQSYTREVKREQGLAFSTRIGVHSGEVVVGKIGDDLRMDYTAQGHTVGLAQRMENLAEPNTCYLSAATADRVAGYFELEDLGDFRLKGVSEPVRVHDLRGLGEARTRFDVSRTRGLTRFVGRDADLRTLEDALAQARDGNGQVLGVVAEAGTGKSRLCFEFAERCRAEGMTVLEGHAVAHGKNLPLLPILQVFRAYYGIDERDDDRTVREKIAGRLLLLDEGFREVLPVMFEFFGVPDPDRPAPRLDPEAKQRQIFGVVRRLVQGAEPQAGARNFVTLIEDLHWFDAGSEAFLEQWVDALAGTSSLLLVNFRPEYHAGWMQKSYYRQIPLAPLGPEAIRELLDDLLGSDPSTRGLADAIHARTAGNPFFTEEVVQSLIESGHLEGTKGSYKLVTPIDRLEVPASVHAVLAARIDRLPERDKQLLQTAAVIGKKFAEPLLAEVAELPERDLAEALQALKDGEFLLEQALYPVAEYAFKHPLTQEVALGSQLGERRRRVHAAVAKAVEATSENLDEQAALLAHHWEEAGEPLDAARWHRRAAIPAGSRHPAEMLRHWRRVCELLMEVPESAETMDLGVVARAQRIFWAGRLGVSDDDVETLVSEATELARRSGDLHSLALVLNQTAFFTCLSGSVEDAHEPLAEAERLVEQVDDAELRLVVSYTRNMLGILAGRWSETRRHAERALAQSVEDPGWFSEALGLHPHPMFQSWRAYCLAFEGRLKYAMREFEQAEASAQRLGDRAAVVNLGFGRVQIAELLGSGPEALAHAARVAELAEEVGTAGSRTIARLNLGYAHLLNERWREAAHALEEGLAILHEGSVFLNLEPLFLAALARAHLAEDRVPEARRVAEEAVRLSRTRAGIRTEALFALVGVLLRSEGAAARQAIEAALEQIQAYLDEAGGVALQPFVHERRAELARLLGDAAAHDRELREAHRLYTEMGATGHVERLARELGS